MPYKDPEKQREYDRVRYQKNKEKILEYKREYYQKNAEQQREKSREYYHKNTEKISEQKREYRQTPQAIKVQRISDWKKQGILSEDYDALYERVASTEKCEFCGVDLTVDRYNTKTTRCLDHDHESGQVRGVLCLSCNSKDVLGK